MAKLNFKYGTMNSGKSIDLMRTAYNYEENGFNTLVLKPMIDTKGIDMLDSRIGLKRKVDILIPKDSMVTPLVLEKLNKNLACIFVDEVQFLSKNQIDELFILTKKLDIPIICYGLRTNFKMEGFDGAIRLLEIAEEIEEIKTLCSCGNIARYAGRKVDGNYTLEGYEVVIDGTDKNIEYVPLCGNCYLQKVKKLTFKK